MTWYVLNVSAAPHLPAGIFSPYSDGEKGLGRSAGILSATLVIGETIGAAFFSPSLCGEKCPAGQ
jgi:hypothetical protein